MGPLKGNLVAKCFSGDADAETKLQLWLQQPTLLYAAAFQKLVRRWKQVVKELYFAHVAA